MARLSFRLSLRFSMALIIKPANVIKEAIKPVAALISPSVGNCSILKIL
jgi:hypothetical protein